MEGDPRCNYQGAVIIPALAESDSLFATLDSLQTNPAALLEQFLLLVVVNHRPDAAASDKQDNCRTLRKLAQAAAGLPNLAWIDAASKGLELPLKTGGVGLARKLGLDLALERLDWAGAQILATLDADTLVRDDYLSALCEHFAISVNGGAVVPFCHPLTGDMAEQQAIIAYELYLRSHVLGLQLAGSPYAFHTVGSTMACRARDYVRAGGMNRRQAGEDFYFLQQVAKTSGMSDVAGTVVYPSARISHRTPFGTGRSVAQLAANTDPAKLYYDPRCYDVLGKWLQMVKECWRSDARELLMRSAAISAALEDFLVKEKFQDVWPGLCRNHGDAKTRLAALHGWFDGLKTTRLIHHLIHAGWHRLAAAQALPELFLKAGLPSTSDPEQQLIVLRRQQIGTACAFCRLSEKSRYCRVGIFPCLPER
jgi:glycosyltransferase involved in cell wall biosynthesis